MARGVKGTGYLPGESCILGMQNPVYHRMYYEKNREAIRAKQNSKRIRSGLSNMDYRKMLMGFLREKDSGKCWLCQKDVIIGDDCVDHVIPRSKGGSDFPDNLRLAHRTCNARRPRHG